MSKSKKTDKEAVEVFKDYLRNKGYSNVERLSTRSKGVTADVKAYSPEGKETYFEVKSTEQNSKCWSRITFHELESALKASKENHDYFFVIIRKGNISNKAELDKRHRFIPIKDKFGNSKNFLSLEDILTFTRRNQFHFGIDINIDFSNAFTANPVRDDPHYTEGEVEKLCEAISDLIPS